MEDEDFEYKAAEERQQEVILDKGMTFMSGDKEYLIAQPRLGQLDKIAAVLLKLDMNKAAIEAEDYMQSFSEQKRMVRPNIKLCAKIVAIAAVSHKRPVLSRYPWYIIKERFMVWKYYQLFFWDLTPNDLLRLTQAILKAANFPDFTSSIALLSVNRTTAPAIEG